MSAQSRPDLLPTNFPGCVDRLVEESGEVLKAIGKLNRFGFAPIDDKTGKRYDNVTKLFAEMRDLEHAISEARRLFRRDHCCDVCGGVGGPSVDLFCDAFEEDAYQGPSCAACDGRGWK